MHLVEDDDLGSGVHEASPVEEYGMDIDPDVIEFFVGGEPVPQGSTRSFYIKKLDRVVTTHMNKNTEGWRQRIATEAQHVNSFRETSFYTDDKRCGYLISLEFYMTRPKSTPKKVHLNTKRPDLDKLIRAALDGITGILIPDDSQVIGISANKCYCPENVPPGLKITLRKLHE
ncbi:MAG: RusA family crossover junction endodeoxyribonuclease [Methanomassiliicoccales archaeon]|nr:MAG: RusA family crossover junction endodeoxyribonuclease [Methanomassiliicoccales archaeon]